MTLTKIIELNQKEKQIPKYKIPAFMFDVSLNDDQ